MKGDKSAITQQRKEDLQQVVKNILLRSIKVDDSSKVLVLYDTMTPMALLLLHAYMNNGVSSKVDKVDLTLASKEGIY